MNVVRYESKIHKEADKLHAKAQQSGNAADYRVAAEMYERAGDYEQARRCYNAAQTAAAK